MYAQVLPFKKPEINPDDIKLRRTLIKQYFALWMETTETPLAQLTEHYQQMRVLYNSLNEEERAEVARLVKNFVEADIEGC